MKRDITEDEIKQITSHRFCPIREKAFFTIMRQSGLTPLAIKQLRIKNVPTILEPDPEAPCKISIPHEKYPAFIEQEAINYLKEYLDKRARREKLTSESLLFTARNSPSKEISTKDVSRTFRRVVQHLAKNRKISLEIRIGKPSELRLYSLVKFYRNNTSAYRKELNNDSTPRNDEFYRNLYEKLAMPQLEIEPPSATDIHKIRKQLKKIQSYFPKEQEDEYGRYLEENPKEYAKLMEQHEKNMKWEKEHLEKAKLKDEQMEYPKELEEQDERFYKEYLEGRVKELENKFKELENTVKKTLKKSK